MQPVGVTLQPDAKTLEMYVIEGRDQEFGWINDAISRILMSLLQQLMLPVHFQFGCGGLPLSMC